MELFNVSPKPSLLPLRQGGDFICRNSTEGPMVCIAFAGIKWRTSPTSVTSPNTHLPLYPSCWACVIISTSESAEAIGTYDIGVFSYGLGQKWIEIGGRKQIDIYAVQKLPSFGFVGFNPLITIKTGC